MSATARSLVLNSSLSCSERASARNVQGEACLAFRRTGHRLLLVTGCNFATLTDWVIANMIMQIEHVSKSFGGRVLFSDASFRLEAHDRLALVGPNGAGKTTLLNIIMGVEDADEGSIVFARGAQAGYLEQEAIEM